MPADASPVPTVHEVVSAAIPVVVLAAFLLGAATLLVARDLRSALGIFLDLLLAGGLLTLSAEAGWRGIGSAAIVLLVRKLAMWALAAHVGRGGPSEPGAQSR